MAMFVLSTRDTEHKRHAVLVLSGTFSTMGKPKWSHTADLNACLFEMAPSVSVHFISLVNSVRLQEEEEPQTAFPHVLYMGISYSCKHAHGMLNFTQSINQSINQSSSRSHMEKCIRGFHQYSRAGKYL